VTEVGGELSERGSRIPKVLRIGYRGTLDEQFSGRNNGIGFIRLMLALSVVASHYGSLGFAKGDLLGHMFRDQEALGGLAVCGFFVLSGMLITRSARRTGFWRYCWHRALRIFPGLWVSLLLTALVIGPLIAIREHGSLSGYWTHPRQPGGPAAYVELNAWTGMQQWGIHDLLQNTTPWGRISGASVFDGALWSLVYEMCCYIVVGALLVSGVLRNSRAFVLLIAVGLYIRIVMDFRLTDSWHGGIVAEYQGVDVQFLGSLSFRWLVYLGFLFALAAVFELYRERIPIHDGLGLASVAAVLGSLLFGGWIVIGYPAFVYMMIWAAVRAPRFVHWVGRKNDYSYGVYIYGFIGQQVMASLGWTRWGHMPFLGLSMVVALVAAFLSWHLVERHALRLKHWTPKRPARWARAVRDRVIPPVHELAEPAGEPTPVPVG
jgi:peptidoglycan/LPS O-acetylase OafA/YrhL